MKTVKNIVCFLLVTAITSGTIWADDQSNRLAMTPATIRSGHAAPLAQTPPAAKITAALPGI